MIYLDNSASSSFKPKEVFGAVNLALNTPFNPSRASHNCSIEAGMLILNARESLANAFNCQSDRVILTSGCTEALNMAIFGLRLKNAHVITTVYEHNSVLRPLYKRQRLGEISLDIVASPSEAKRAIRPNTELIVVNHVSNVTGFESDLNAYAQLAKKYNALLLLDAAQSAGYKPIDIKSSGIDMLAVAAHKGLHGIQGAGALCLSTNPQIRLKPTKYGGTGAFTSQISQPNDIPEGFEAGTPPTPAICAMAAGLNWSIAHQKENVEKLNYLSTLLIEGLADLRGVRVFSKPNPFGIVAFCLEKIPSQQAGDHFNQMGFALRCGFHCAPLAHKHLNTSNGLIRASFGIESTPNDVYALIKATKSITY